MTEKQMADMFARAGAMIGSHEIVAERTASGTAYHVRWRYENGTITMYSRGGSASAVYEWEFVLRA